MKIPKRVNNCPIAESVLEVRFNSSVPEEAVFGIFYNVIQKDVQNVEKLPLLQLPNDVRNSNPDLKYKPLYKLHTEKYFLQIGPRVFSISIKQGKYPGWNDFSKQIQKYFDLLNTLNVVQKYNRLGLRYINFFEYDIFKGIKFDISIDGEKHHSSELLFRSMVEQNDFKVVLQINNTTQLASNSGQPRKGSVVDIDVIGEKLDEGFVKLFPELISKAHNIVEEKFFTLLKEDTIITLNPIYE